MPAPAAWIGSSGRFTRSACAAPVAIAGVVAGGAAQADLVKRPLDPIQAAGAGIRTRVVIDHGAHTAPGRFDQSDERAVIDIRFVERAVQTRHQSFFRIAGKSAGGGPLPNGRGSVGSSQSEPRP